MQRRLMLMRHAKSAWQSQAPSDHERPLNERGRRNAPRVGKRLAELGWVPDHVIGSDSRRTRETWERMQALMDRETGPTLRPVPGIDLRSYKATLIERFANPAINDTVERVNTDAPLNVLVDPIRDRLKTGQSVDLLALALAAWLRRMRGVDEAGHPIEIRHPAADLLRERAIEGAADPRPMLAIERLFGELARHEPFVNSVAKWLASLYAAGAVQTLARAERELAF